MKFGMVAFLLSLIALGVPVYGIMIGWAALALACIAALYGDKVFTVATVLVSIINYLFLSPNLLLSALNPTDSNWIEISMLMVGAPIVALMVRKLTSLRK